MEMHTHTCTQTRICIVQSCPSLTTLGLPVELDQSLLANLVDHLEGVDTEALHVAVVEGDADVVQEEGELQGTGGRHRETQAMAAL